MALERSRRMTSRMAEPRRAATRFRQGLAFDTPTGKVSLDKPTATPSPTSILTEVTEGRGRQSLMNKLDQGRAAGQPDARHSRGSNSVKLGVVGRDNPNCSCSLVTGQRDPWLRSVSRIPSARHRRQSRWSSRALRVISVRWSRWLWHPHADRSRRTARDPRFERRRQDDAVQYASPATSCRPAAASASSARTSPSLPPHERIRRGTAAHLPDLAALQGAERHRFDLPRLPRRLAAALLADPARRQRRRRDAGAAELLVDAVHLRDVAERDILVANALATASSASSRSRWRCRVRRASSCSTSRPPACRRPSGATSSPSSPRVPKPTSATSSSSTIMDVALRVAESVTMMHNGRIFKEGKPEPRSRSDPAGPGPLSRRGRHG